MAIGGLYRKTEEIDTKNHAVEIQGNKKECR